MRSDLRADAGPPRGRALTAQRPPRLGVKTSLICVLFFLSGSAALVYELLWFRHLGLIFGNTVHAAATVLTAYMAGLGIGAWAAGRWAHRSIRPLPLFGLIEASIGLYAAAMPLFLLLVQTAYQFAYRNVSQSVPILTALRFSAAFALLLVPTSLMGATLPLLSQAVAPGSERFGLRLSFLYGANTAGAMAGVLLAGFVLVPVLGLTGATIVAVTTNIAVGVGAGLLAGRPNRRTASLPDTPVEPVSRATGATGLLMAAGAAGFLSLALEVVWFRALVLVFGSTTYSFTVMLAVFLGGIALGALLLSWVADRSKAPLLVFGCATMVAGLFTILSLYAFTRAPEALLRFLSAARLSWARMLLAQIGIAAVFLMVPAAAFGAAFPAVVRAVRERAPSSSRAVGNATVVNTFCAAAGSCAAGFALLPALGILNSLLALGGGAVLTGLLGFLAERRRASRVGAWAALPGLACAVLCVAHPPRWDRQILSAGPYFAPWNFIRSKQSVREKVSSERLLLFREGLTCVVATTVGADEKLYFSMDGKVEADTTARSMMLQRMLGHLPMLFHPDPRRVLNIGLGAGVTLGALSCYPVDRLEVVEIEPDVSAVARLWRKHNHGVTDNPRVTVTINDGRNHLLCTAASYDVIASDPFEPMVGGAASLYTVDHFANARRRLAPGGMMSQYVPLYELSAEDYAMILRSFVRVFPHSYLFFTGCDTILLGVNGQNPIRPQALLSRFSIPSVSNSLAGIGFAQPATVLGLFAADLRAADRPMALGGPVNTDRRPFLEFSAPRNALRYSSDRNQRVLLSRFTEMPPFLMEGLTADQREAAVRAHSSLRIALRASVDRGTGTSLAASIERLTEAATLSPGNPVVRNELVTALTAEGGKALAAGAPAEAIRWFRRALEYEPGEFWALYYLAAVSLDSEDVETARTVIGQALKVFPASPLLHEQRARCRAMADDLRGAFDDIRVALEALPGKADFWDTHADLCAAAGNDEEAARAARKATALRAKRPPRN